MSDDRRRDLVLEDLSSILVGSASPTSVATKPYASHENGLCRRDAVRIKYELKNKTKRQGPFRPIGVGVASQFHYLGYRKAEETEARQRACSQLSDKNIYWAFDDDDHHAAFALNTLTSTVADVRENRRFTIDCSELSDKDRNASCASQFLAAATQISRILRCDVQQDRCYSFLTGRYWITISRTYPRSLNGEYTTSIKMADEPIVVT